MLRRSLLSMFLIIGVMLMAGTAVADTSVAWISPADGSSYPAGTAVDLTGQAGATGIVGGTGLDLAIVMDSSGSMTYYDSGAGMTIQAAQKEAAHALVDALPAGTTSVTIIEFDYDANTVQTLAALTTDISAIHAAIDSVDASGGTYIGTGIDAATAELTSVRHTAGSSQMMVVMSDGYTSGNPETNAASAIAAGIDAIHTVGLPGHSVYTMQDIADGPDDVVGTSDDYGVYADASNLSQLISIFDGTGGNLVGLEHVDIQLADGTWSYDIATDGLGNFVLPDEVIALGANTYTAYAYGTDGTSASATLTLYGMGDGTQPVPEPATMLLLGSGLIGLAGFRRKVSKR